MNMSSLLPLPILYLLLLCADAYNWRDEISCPANNQSADLKFVPPTDSDIRQSIVATYLEQRFLMQCCATGYSHVTWYKDGVKLEPTNSADYEYNNETTREAIAWRSLGREDCKLIPNSLFYACIFTCEAYSINEQKKISETITVDVYINEARPCHATIPEFVNATAEKCLSEGEDLLLYCQLQFANSTPCERTIQIILENGTAIYDLIDWSIPNNTRRIHPRYTNRYASSISYYITILNVTSEFLDKNYTCRAYGAQAKFSVERCREEIPVTTEVKKPSDASSKIAIILSVIVFMVVIATILLVRFNDYASLWFRVRILQKFQRNGYYQYDVYVISKDLSHPRTLKSIELLEELFQLNVCIADRDFIVGAMTAESIGSNIKSSRKVVAFLSNDMFREEQGAHDWSEVSLSLSLALNKPTMLVLLEEIDFDILTKRKEIKSALQVLDCIKCTSSNDNSLYPHFKRFFSKPVDLGLAPLENE
ncbi:interleukin-1 receptor accessory protein-like [Watersipora subatra]|uniref:interleukin-1 receptor accessory protein-like n=1 Tax=Watersipora subatra TaxID=2589382 RepID=UPI00355BBD1D